MTAVWELAPYSENKLIVLLALADWSNDNGYCWPSMQALADKARIDIRSARRIIRSLQNDDLLSVVEGGGRAKQNHYQINLAKLDGLETRTQRPSLQNSDMENTDTGGIKTRTLETQTRTLGAETRTRVSADPLVEPSIIQPSIDPPYGGAAFLEALEAFQDSRKTMRKPLTTTARRLLFRKLAGWDEGRATQALEDAVINRWQGVFEPRVNGNGANNGKSDRSCNYQTPAERRNASTIRNLERARQLRSGGNGTVDDVLRGQSGKAD